MCNQNYGWRSISANVQAYLSLAGIFLYFGGIKDFLHPFLSNSDTDRSTSDLSPLPTVAAAVLCSVADVLVPWFLSPPDML